MAPTEHQPHHGPHARECRPAGDPDAPPIFKRLFDLALPVIGLNVLSVLSLAVDTAMCGRLPNAEDALKALGFATQVVFLLMVAMMGLVVGAVASVSRAHGAGDEARVRHVMRQSTQLTVLVSLVVAVVGNLAAPTILRALGASPDVLGLGLDYLRPHVGFTVFYYLSILYAGLLRGVGNTRLPFLVALVSNGLNVFLNYGLILGNYGMPALGVQGAAIGTVISQAVGVTLLIGLLAAGRVQGLRLPLRPEAIDGRIARDLFRIGAPAALDMVILNAGFVSIIGMLGRIDEVAVAAHGVGLRVQALAFIPGLSISQATGAMVGNALGAENVAEAKAVVRSSLVLCLLIMTSVAVAIVAGASGLVALFDVPEGSELHALAVEWMRILGYGMPVVGVHIAFVGMFRGAGATRTSLWINILGTLLVQIPLSWLLGFPLGFGVAGVWAGFPLSFVVKAALGAMFYRQGAWAQTGTTLRARPA
ncbi:MAG: MATE family efflux transporter [Myxococcota bacterium]